MRKALLATNRRVLRVGGVDAENFLQGLVTNDVGRLSEGLVYTALLSAQGKYLFDFFLLRDGSDILIDVKADRAEQFAQRLALYRLRAAVSISADARNVVVGIGPVPEVGRAFADPRHSALGWRAYLTGSEASLLLERTSRLDPAEVAALRVQHVVPESGLELTPNESYILEMGFERLRGVDFRKGCYVGQEVTARMKHKTALRKGLVRVRIEGVVPPPGTAITNGERSVGTLWTSAGDTGIAYLRFDRLGGAMSAGDARLTLIEVPS